MTGAPLPTSLSAPHEAPRVVRRCSVALDTTAKVADIDGVRHAAAVGHWMFYVPDTLEKFFHARNGATDCIHATRPTDQDLGAEWANETYASADWRRALSTPVERRLAELWVACARLWTAGLGPRPLGVTFADRFARDGVPLGPTVGLILQQVDDLPVREACTDADMLAAGVRPDRIRSSVRQQIRGYVIDLTSVVGAEPVDAEADVRRAGAWIAEARRGPRQEG